MISNGPLKVFLADDSLQIRERVGAMLAGPGGRGGRGPTPATCIAGILDLHPDVVVLDVQLEGGTGLEVLRAVRGADPRGGLRRLQQQLRPRLPQPLPGRGGVRFLDKSTEFDQLPQAVASAGGRDVH